MKMPPLSKAIDLTLASPLESLSPYEAYDLAFQARRAIEGQHLSFQPTKAIIFDFFDKKISKSAIRKWDDGFSVIGNTCIVNLEPDGVIDVWICNPEDMYAGLGQKAVKHRRRAFESYDTSAVIKLDGEAWVKTRDKNLVLRNLKLLGIRKRAERSPESHKAMIENLKLARTKRKASQTSSPNIIPVDSGGKYGGVDE